MKLKSKLKAVLAAVTFAFAGAAVADINPGNTTSGPQSNNGELFLSVWNTTLQVSYTRDLGINLSNFLPSGAVAPVDNGAGVDYAFGAGPTIGAGNVLNPGYNLTFGLDGTAASSTLATLLGTAGTIWSVVGSENFGNDRMLFTSNAPSPTFATGQLTTATGNVVSHLGGVNALQSGAADNTANGSSTATPPSIAYSGGTVFGSNIGTFGFSTAASVGTAMNFWFANQTATTTSTISQFDGGQWLLASDGTLSWDVAQAAPIPEPGTWAMLAAGLAMIGGIARRRSQG
jgi:hypothetical protein